MNDIDGIKYENHVKFIKNIEYDSSRWDFVEKGEHGLENQRLKTSGNNMCRPAGTLIYLYF